MKNKKTKKKGLPKVYFTSDISSKGLMKIYKSLGRKLKGRVAVKLHSGEPGKKRLHILAPNMIKDLVKHVKGTIVECNTGVGARHKTEKHKQVIINHGYASIAPTDILDEDGEIPLPVKRGKHIKENYVGVRYKDYDSFLILSHFKGHMAAGFGGAIKNMAIGIASSKGKIWLHTAGKYKKFGFGAIISIPGSLINNKPFLESMAEAAGSIIDDLGENLVYINVMNNLSVDCDCIKNPKKPEMKDIGILGSLDPVALDKACVDLVYGVKDGSSEALKKRIESKNGMHTLNHAEAIGLGSQKYKLIKIDK